MPSRVFFSFDAPDDLWRASVVRNRWIMEPGLTATGFWEKEFIGPLQDRLRLDAFIDEQVEDAEVTTVLIGARTSQCAHVTRAIRRSVDLGRGLLAIYVDKCKDRYGATSRRGSNPFEQIMVHRADRLTPLAGLVPTYDWIDDDGFNRLRDWVDEAAAGGVTRP